MNRRQFLASISAGIPVVSGVGANLLSSGSEAASYRGIADSASWRRSAKERIEVNRKGDFTVRLVDSQDRPLKNQPIRAKLFRHDFGFGGAPKLRRLYSQEYPLEIRELYHDFCEVFFNKLTPENSLKWKWHQANEEYTQEFLGWCEQKQISVRGHCLVWPDFRRAAVKYSNFKGTPEELDEIITEHISYMLRTYNGPIDEWDVLNEPRSNRQFMDILGDDVVIKWFRQTASLAPGIKRYINDYNILTKDNPRHRNIYFNYIKKLLKRDTPISGIGFQCHIPRRFEPTAPEELLDSIDKFSPLGLDLQVTEFDFETSNQDLQARYTEDFMTAIFSHPDMVGLVTWTPFEYAKNSAPKPDAALIDRNLQIKPNGSVWYDLVNKVWSTDTELYSDDNGEISFRGFKGLYHIQTKQGRHEALLTSERQTEKIVI